MKRFIFLFSLILVIPLFIYNFLPYDSLLLLGSNNNPLPKKNNLSPNEDIVTAYTIVIDSLFNEELSINPNIEYISVDTTDMINLNNKEKHDLLSYLKKHNVITFDNTLEELESKGLIANGNFTNGIFIKIEDSPIYNNTIAMKTEKWHSFECDITSNKFIVEKSLDGWIIVDNNPLCII